MPRTPIDYSKTIIYKLVCKDVNVTELYVGSTTNFKNRKNNHKSDCHNPNAKEYNYKVYQFIRANGGFQNFSMIAIEKYPCNDKLESDKRERLWIETLQSRLNGSIPSRTHRESDTQYHQNNKAKIYKKHICRCGCRYTHANKTHHCKTQKHIYRINLFETVDSIISLSCQV